MVAPVSMMLAAATSCSYAKPQAAGHARAIQRKAGPQGESMSRVRNLLRGLKTIGVEVKPPAPEPVLKNQIICCAIKTPTGRVFRGHRHFQCQRAAQHAGEAAHVIRLSIQGFIDARNEFVDRYEALDIQVAAGIDSKNPVGYIGNQLYSEDLY